MLSKIISAALIGLEAEKITVEFDVGKGMHHFVIVGLPDTAISESKERINLAIKNSGKTPPYHKGRMVVNLAPADIRKEGPSYDLPLAIGFLRASDQLNFDENDKMFMGELALDGLTRPINGVLPRVMLAKKIGLKEVYLPEDNAKEASLIDGIEIYPVKNLKQLIDHFKGQKIRSYKRKKTKIKHDNIISDFDFSLIKGQNQAKRALEIAAAGGHNVLMSGAPGSGKTMLARSLPTILPDMNKEEMLEVTKIFSVAGKLSEKDGLVKIRPFRSPHHSASGVSLVGGGSVPKPGEISLAHRGILFLDELPEFDRKVLECLRQPLEDGFITITRAGGVAQFPAEFILVASMNPCPCGFLGDPEKECTCSQNAIQRYQKTISGPLLDRIDILIEVPRLSYDKIRGEETKSDLSKNEENSEAVRLRVTKARKIQEKRFKKQNFLINSEISSKMINKYCYLSKEAELILKSAVETMHLSGRSINRILKVSRTIADLANMEKITPEHIAEAVQYRKGILAVNS